MTKIRKFTRMLKHMPVKTGINWYPGHMYWGLQAMMRKLATVDCVVELHDARLPFIGRNKEFKDHLGQIKPRLLVLNKMDLADLTHWDYVKEKLSEQGDKHVLLTDLTGTDQSFATRGYDKILEKVMKLITTSDRSNREKIFEYNIMIAGIPNVGKSTLINRLRQLHMGSKGEPAKTAPQPGFTKSIQNLIKVCHRPPIYVLDTPGVLEPRISKFNQAHLKIALCSSISDKVVNPLELANFLLRYLNEFNDEIYKVYYDVDRQFKDTKEFLTYLNDYKKRQLAEKQVNYQTKDRHVYSEEDAAWKLIHDFRRGSLGKVMF